MRLIKKIVLIVLMLVVAVLGSLYLFQDAIIFRSIKLAKDHIYTFDQPYDEYFVKTQDGEEINLLWFKAGENPKGLIFYFHGNAGNLNRWGAYAQDLTKLGYEVVMMDYRSYGKSSGKPSEENLYADSELIYQWALPKTSLKKIIIYGRSLGTPVATRLASHVKPALLILETPFDRLSGALPSVLSSFSSVLPLRHEFPTIEFLKAVECKAILFHGTQDNVVPLHSAQHLQEVLKKGDEFIIIQGGNHRNLRTYEVYQNKIQEALR